MIFGLFFRKGIIRYNTESTTFFSRTGLRKQKLPQNYTKTEGAELEENPQARLQVGVILGGEETTGNAMKRMEFEKDKKGDIETLCQEKDKANLKTGHEGPGVCQVARALVGWTET